MASEIPQCHPSLQLCESEPVLPCTG